MTTLSFTNPNQYTISQVPQITATKETEEPKCENYSWVWIIFIILLLGVIAGLIVWIVWLIRREKTDQKCRQLILNNPSVTVVDDTTLNARWDKLDDENDIVTMYVSKNPLILNKDGTVSNSTFPSKTAAKGQNSITFTPVNPTDIYYVMLVVTNSKTNNFYPWNTTVYMQVEKDITSPSTAIQTEADRKLFQISDLATVGAISLHTESGNEENVVYVTKDELNPKNEWFYVSGNANTDQKIYNDQEVNNDEQFCLYAKMINNEYILAAESCSSNTLTQNNSK